LPPSKPLIFFPEALPRFSNGELHYLLERDVKGRSCLLIGSIAPPEEQLFSFLIVAHTLKKEGAKKVTAFLPYLSYSRHDKKEKRHSHIAPLIGKLFQTAGIDKLFTLDLHSPAVKKLFPFPLISLSTAPLFVRLLKKYKKPFSIVAPDEGAKERCQTVAKMLKVPTAWIHKTRTSKGIVHKELLGTVTENAVIIDDILDTGETLLSCAQVLRERGVKEILIMVTHGLFTKTKWKALWKLGVKKIYCTDTVPILQKDRRICTLSIKKEFSWTKLSI